MPEEELVNAPVGSNPEIDVIKQDEAINQESKPADLNPSAVSLLTHIDNEDYSVFGVSFFGRLHMESEMPCQDYHAFSDLGDGWHVYVVSDGAGSASQSHRGSKINCEVAIHLIEELISKTQWKNAAKLPTETEWQVQFTAVCKALKAFIQNKVEELDEPVAPKDFNATLLLLIVTPKGMLSGHIGDGRMGYESKDGEWHSLMVPHKGEEPNQTVFVMNAWDQIRVPALKMSGEFVPSTRVTPVVPESVCLLTDGCENASWNCTQWDKVAEHYEDVNTPFVPYWDGLLNTLADAECPKEAFTEYIDSHNEASRKEGDDRTLLLGIYKDKNVATDEEP